MSKELANALRGFIPHVMRRENMPGFAIAVALDGELVWEEGFGYADLGSQTPMTPQTIFRSGSMGKTYTATAVMQLAEQGVLDIDAPINDVLDFEVHNPLGERDITTFDLLTHQAGMQPNGAGSTFGIPAPLGDHLRERYANDKNDIGMQMFTTKVGETFQYSNLGMATLGRIVELTNPDKLDFSEYVQRNIIEPLQMTSTQYPPVQAEGYVRPDLWERRSTGYAMFGPVRIPTMRYCFADFPAGCIMTTPGDHIRVLLAYLNGGEYQGGRILKPETVERMLSPQLELVPGFALGITWMLRNVGEENFSFGHGGAHMYGWENDYRAYPKLGLAIVTAANEWPMLKTRYWGHNLVLDFSVSWMQNEGRRGFRRPDNSWAWKVSYVIGTRMGAGCVGLGDGPPTPEMIDAMAAGVEVGPGGDGLWDEAGFRTGLDDVVAGMTSPRDYVSFFTSDDYKVSPVEQELIVRELGAPPTTPTVRPD